MQPVAAGPDESCKCIVLIALTACYGFYTPKVFDTPVYLCCHRLLIAFATWVGTLSNLIHLFSCFRAYEHGSGW